MTGRQRDESAGFIPPHGGYENLLSYQKALIVYDATNLLLPAIHRQARSDLRPNGAGRTVG